MNQLSQLIYFADVVGGADGLFLFISITSAFLTLVFTGIHVGMKADECVQPLSLKWGMSALGCFFLFCFLTVATPSKETVYAISASEVGEEIVNSDTANKAKQALNRWLDKQIQDVEPVKTEEEKEAE
jgi:hypothetical protein